MSSSRLPRSRPASDSSAGPASPAVAWADPGWAVGPTRGHDRPRHAFGVPRRGKLGHEHPVGKLPRDLGRYPEREAGLSDPARAGERDQPAPGQRAPDAGRLL